MKTSLYVAFVISVLCLSACSANKTLTSKSSDIQGAGVVQYPIVAELDVAPAKVSGTVVWKGGRASTNTLKEMAIAEAVKSANADVLIEPRFEIEVKGRKKTVTATGFPAKYKSFRNAVAEDTLVLKIGTIQKAQKYETMPEIKKISKTGKFIFGTVVLAGVVALVGWLL